MIKGGKGRVIRGPWRGGPFGDPLEDTRKHLGKFNSTFRDLQASKKAQPYRLAGLLRLIQDPWDRCLKAVVSV